MKEFLTLKPKIYAYFKDYGEVEKVKGIKNV